MTLSKNSAYQPRCLKCQSWCLKRQNWCSTPMKWTLPWVVFFISKLGWIFHLLTFPAFDSCISLFYYTFLLPISITMLYIKIVRVLIVSEKSHH